MREWGRHTANDSVPLAQPSASTTRLGSLYTGYRLTLSIALRNTTTASS